MTGNVTKMVARLHTFRGRGPCADAGRSVQTPPPHLHPVLVDTNEARPGGPRWRVALGRVVTVRRRRSAGHGSGGSDALQTRTNHPSLGWWHGWCVHQLISQAVGPAGPGTPWNPGFGSSSFFGHGGAFSMTNVSRRTLLCAQTRPTQASRSDQTRPPVGLVYHHG
jgi:hypothetical protein